MSIWIKCPNCGRIQTVYSKDCLCCKQVLPIENVEYADCTDEQFLKKKGI